MSDIKTWPDLVKATRLKLGITREEFAMLLGISLATLNGWEYYKNLPNSMCQQVIVELYNRGDEVKKLLLKNKSKFVPMGACGDCTNNNFWKGVLAGGAAVGVLALLISLGGKK